MKKRTLLWCAAALLVCVVLLLLFGGYRADGLEDLALQGDAAAAQGWGRFTPAATLYESREGFLLEGEEALSGAFSAPEAGEYTLWLRYRTEGEGQMEQTLTLTLGQTAYGASVPAIWQEEARQRTSDRYGNELNAPASMAEAAVDGPMLRQGDVGGRGLQVTLTPGEQSFRLTGGRGLRVYGLYLTAGGEEAIPLSTAPQEPGEALLMVEGENYALKSDSYIRGKNVKNPVLSPYESLRERINVVDAQSWSKVGQKLLWELPVAQAGWYRVAFRYSQYSEANKFSYRTLTLDGKAVLDRPVAFPSTGMNVYENLTLTQNGQEIWLYLEPGNHTLGMEAVMDPLLSPYQEILALMQQVNDISMDLRKMTAGNRDANRTWDMEQYLPQVPGELEDCRDRIGAIYQSLREVEGVEPSYANQLLYAQQQLDNLLEDRRLIPNKAGVLCEGDGSVNSALGQVLEKLVEQPLSLDRIYLYQNGKLPGSHSNLLVDTAEALKRLGATYLPGAGGADYTAEGGDSQELQVWVNMSISYAEVLQQMIDEDYNPAHGSNILLSIMPNEQKLILSNATGDNPDVVLGVNFYTPYELAIRGAAKNLLEYPDFAAFYTSQYNPAGLTPLAYDGGIYGAVDSLNYQVLFYRKDILDSLGLPVPETWEDVQNMMPVLHRYSMNFYSSLATSSSFKTFNMTGPFLYQNGGTFYREDGASVAIQEPEAQQGLEQMTELFRIYSLSKSVANFFNSFRYGEIPLGVGNFATYVQLQTAAPELAGQWGVALVPGQRQADGSVAHDQAADSTASMIFRNTDKPEEAWEFLKWWLSQETQAAFSNRLERTYGAAYRWNTANLAAFAGLPYPEEHKQVILAQVAWQRETPRHPAGYMVEREVSNLWNQVVVNGKGLTESIDRAVIASDREIRRKLTEFGFMGEDGTLLRPYTTEDVLSWLNVEREEDSPYGTAETMGQ